MDIIITCILTLIIIIAIFIRVKSEQNRKKELIIKEQMAKQRAIEREKQDTIEYEKRKQQIQNSKNILESQWGPISKEITLHIWGDGDTSLNDRILIFESTQHIKILENVYKFSDILNFDITDNKETTIREEGGTSITQTSTGNMLGRAVVGGVLLGGVGALAGATTAQTKTEYNPSSKIINEIHDYTIHININSFSSPIVSIHMKDNARKTQEISGILNIIIKMNNEQANLLHTKN